MFSRSMDPSDDQATSLLIFNGPQRRSRIAIDDHWWKHTKCSIVLILFLISFRIFQMRCPQIRTPMFFNLNPIDIEDFWKICLHVVEYGCFQVMSDRWTLVGGQWLRMASKLLLRGTYESCWGRESPKENMAMTLGSYPGWAVWEVHGAVGVFDGLMVSWYFSIFYRPGRDDWFDRATIRFSSHIIVWQLSEVWCCRCGGLWRFVAFHVFLVMRESHPTW